MKYWRSAKLKKTKELDTDQDDTDQDDTDQEDADQECNQSNATEGCECSTGK